MGNILHTKQKSYEKDYYYQDGFRVFVPLVGGMNRE
jgi:hypothetical protein